MSAPVQGTLCEEPRKAPDELPYEKGHLWVEKYHLNTVARRVTPLDVLLLEFIDCYTRSAALKVVDAKGNRRRPEFGQIPTELFVRFTGASERNINLRLSHLEKIQYIGRERPKAETHRGGYKTIPENFRKRELPAPKPKRECRPKTAEQRGPRGLAALEQRTAEPPVQQPPAEPSVEAKIGRMILHALAESGKLPSVAEIATAHGLALPEGMPTPSESPVQPTASKPEVRTGLQDAPPPVAEVPRAFAAWAATHCSMASACPFVHGPSGAPPTEPQPEPQNGTVGRSVQPEAPTDRPTQTPSTPELEPELAAIAAAIPEKLCEALCDSPTRSLLELIRLGLDGAPPSPWLTRAIDRAAKRITSLGMLAHRNPDGRIGGLAVDASVAWKKWRAQASTRSPSPAIDPADLDKARHYEQEQADRREHLLAHPEDCPQCHGTGKLVYEGKKFTCGCPAGERMLGA